MLRCCFRFRTLGCTVLALGSFTLAAGAFALAAGAAESIERLRCEYRVNPQGIDAEHPRLSWNLRESDSTVRGTTQSAYQILVASTADKLARDDGDLWDSGRVESDKSIQIPYEGKSLASREECFWKVRVWNQAGKATAWSERAHWTMGILHPADWNAEWIGLDGDEEPVPLADTSWIWSSEGDAGKGVPPGERYFRRSFEVPTGRTIKHVEYLATADDQCKAFINGRDIGGRDNFRTVKQHDLTTDIKPGKNLLAVIGINKGQDDNPAGIVGIMTITFEKGEPLVIRTDESWKVSDQSADGWNTDPNFDDSKWHAAQVTGPVGMPPWGDVRAPEDRRLPARYLRKEFTREDGKKVRRATVSLSGLGLSELYLNGKKVGDDVLSPGATEYPKRAFYVTHDVTEQIKGGENAIGVILGNGRFYSMRSKVYAGMPHYGFPKLLLNLRIEYEDGSTQEIVSDDTWKLTADGPIVANNEYDGEEYDARKEVAGWSEAACDDARWRAVELVEAPEGDISAQMIEPIRVVETIKPVKITEPKPGVYVVDLGQNMVGWCRLNVSGPAGTRVQLRFGETVNPDGTLYLANIRGAKVTDIYTLKGAGAETWEPRFTYHGFRYVEITGFPGKPTLDTLAGRVVHDDLEVVGQFACSNELINQIYKNVYWGTRGNYRSLPTDCPQRDERQGWLGDRSEESKGESYIFDIAALYSKWLQDMEDSQRPSGSVPDVCPAHWPFYSDNVTWPSTTVIVPNMLLRQYADQGIVARHYDSAKKWVDYMLGFVQEGIIDRDSYGDWCVPPEDPKLIHSLDPGRKTDTALLATSYLYYDLRLMERYANLLGKQDDARHFGHKAEKLAKAFNAKFLKASEGQYDNGTQTSCVLPLRFGLVPEELRPEIFAHLVEKIENQSKGHIGTGLIGGQYLNQVLSDHGRADLSYTMATQTEYPGWGYMIKEGATTIWELWNGNTADPTMNSHNHVMLVGDFVIWLYEYVAGIAPDDANPGFKHLVMKPHPVGDLRWVKCSFRSPYGLVRSEWQQDGDAFDWQITVPPNTTATAYVPASDAEAVIESGKSAKEAEGVKFVRTDGGSAVFELTSGSYRFESN